MTTLLKAAFKKASRLPDDAQDVLAGEILADIESESRWQETLAKPQVKIDKLAEKALEQYRAGKTWRKGFDEL